MSSIHPTAIIGKNVKLGEGNDIGPGCVIEEGVVLGSNNKLWMNVYIGPGTTIGDENQIHMGAILGHLPQDLAFSGAPTFAHIGNRNTIREYVTIHRGTKEGSSTLIGDDNFLMTSAHVGHNVQIGNHNTLVNLATLAGYCVLEDNVLISGMVVVHQFVRLGKLSMISGLSAVNKDVPPYMLCGGRPAVIQGLNALGLRRAEIGLSERSDIKRAFRLLYREGLNVKNALDEILKQCKSSQVADMVEFVKASERGICAGLPSISKSSVSPHESILPRKP